MTTNVVAFQNLYVSFGGQLTDTYEDIANGAPVSDYTVTSDMVNALAKIAGTTLELPAVSASDNGKLLTVVNGAWDKADTPTELPAVSTSDEGKALIVNSQGKWTKYNNLSMIEATFSKTGSTYSVSGITKTYSNIRKLLQNGKQIVLSSSLGGTVFTNTSFQFASGIDFMNALPNTTLNFNGIGVDNGDVYAVTVSIASDNTATMTATKLNA